MNFDKPKEHWIICKRVTYRIVFFVRKMDKPYTLKKEKRGTLQGSTRCETKQRGKTKTKEE